VKRPKSPPREPPSMPRATPHRTPHIVNSPNTEVAKDLVINGEPTEHRSENLQEEKALDSNIQGNDTKLPQQLRDGFGMDFDFKSNQPLVQWLRLYLEREENQICKFEKLLADAEASNMSSVHSEDLPAALNKCLLWLKSTNSICFHSGTIVSLY